MMYGEHERCYEEMRRINSEWAERYYNSQRVKRVLITEGDHHGTWQRVGNIDRIVYEPDGLTIFLK